MQKAKGRRKAESRKEQAKAEGRGWKAAEGRRLNTEGKRQKAEGRQKDDGRRQKADGSKQ